MLYRVIADCIVFIHFLWILFLIFGVILGRKYRAAKICHITGLGFAVLSQIIGWHCPLTYVEIWLRKQYDPTLQYRSSFIIHYVEQLVYLDVSREMVFFLTAALVVVSLYAYIKRKD